MKLIDYFHGALATSLNILLYTVTGGHFLWLEGRVTGGLFRNWSRQIKFRPDRLATPSSEEQLIRVVRESKKLRVFGSGHSFNSGLVSDETLLSLDSYNAILEFDEKAKTITVQAGMRVRDLATALLKRGVAFEALPSHDAQSIGGILSTDVHGTGRDWGFVSQSILKLKIVDGTGAVYTCGPEDDLFKAAIGGIGAVGIISEVTVQAIDRFNIRQDFQISTLSYLEENFDLLHDENQHFGFFAFPFTEKCQLNRWNLTVEPKSNCGPFREFVAISVDALLASWVGNLLSYSRLLPKLSDFAHGTKRGTNLVMESHRAHNRTIYHRHQEIEFAIDYKKVFVVCRQLLEEFEGLYEKGLPYFILEVRFTPAGHDRTLIGPGQGRRTAWIDIISNDTSGFEIFYDRAEKILKDAGGRPHLGKFTRQYDGKDLEAIYGDRYRRLVGLISEHDPDGKFSNSFTRRLFS